MSPAALAALVGAALGALVWAAGGVWYHPLVGAFLGIWLWLFWRALRTDRRVRWLAVGGGAEDRYAARLRLGDGVARRPREA